MGSTVGCPEVARRRWSDDQAIVTPVKVGLRREATSSLRFDVVSAIVNRNLALFLLNLTPTPPPFINRRRR
jgi:hypothetical protein